MSKFFGAVVLWSVSMQLFASSTFVGNGGDLTYFDLNVVRSEIEKTARKIHDPEDLCTCRDELSTHPLCQFLEKLNKSQEKVCAETLVAYRKELAALAAKDSEVTFVWSENSIIAQEGQNTRPVDAVAQKERKRIIISREKFLSLRETQRIALVTHELLHLIKVNGIYIEDDAPNAPFSSGREFLDTMGAALAVKAYEWDVMDDFSSHRDVSRATHNYSLGLHFLRIEHERKFSKKLPRAKQSSASTLFFEYKPTEFSLRLGIDWMDNATFVAGDKISVTEKTLLGRIGAGYSIYPFADHMSRWSQTRLSFHGDALYGNAKQEIKDDFVTMDDRSAVYGVALSAQLALPLIYQFWIDLGYEFRYLKYNYATVAPFTEQQHALFIGGYYGF